MFLLLYILYIILMYFNTPLGSWLVLKFSCCPSHLEIHESEAIVMYRRPAENDANWTKNTFQLTNSTGNIYVITLQLDFVESHFIN